MTAKISAADGLSPLIRLGPDSPLVHTLGHTLAVLHLRKEVKRGYFTYTES